MKKALLKKYAELIVRSGLAVRKGQSVVVTASVENEAFIAMIVEECYKAGAKHVIVDWTSEMCTRIALKKGKKENLATVLPHQIARQEWMCEELPCRLYIESSDPDALAGIDPKKMAYIRGETMKVIYPYAMKRSNHEQWCIAGAPSEAWAKKVFPDLPKKKAVEALWQAILETSRAADGNGIANWEAHEADLKKRSDYLNSLHLRKLHYTSKNGTDLMVGLIPGVIFLGGGEKTLEGDFIQPNIPSEEIFTSPMRGEAEGIVYSAKPLSYSGVLIKDFWVKFHEGKAVEVHAEQGQEVLESILHIDEGSAYLGECALVPFDSPINNTGLLFYSTLYDENAACHLALGRGFTNLYPNFEQYDEETLHSFGINKSMSHVDFMIGSEDLNIDGITEEGKVIPIFRNGNWAF